MPSEPRAIDAQETTKSRWLSIIGMGADGIASLSPHACDLIRQAELVVGGARHLNLASALLTGETLAWPSPLRGGLPMIVARRGQPVVVLASGDPFFFGVGSLLSQHIPAAEFICLPAPSSVALATARLGWAQQTTEIVSLHGRPLENIIPFLQPRARILALSWDETTPDKLASLLMARGFGDSRFHILENLGGPRERIRSTTAGELSLTDIDALNIIALEVTADAQAHILPRVSGLADHLFEHDGQLTKREIRAVTLSALAPRAGEILWDIGLGAGSIAIEWLLAHPSCRAIGIERDKTRAERARRNAVSLGVPRLEVIEGAAPAALSGLPVPDAIFIGGGATTPGVFEAAWAALKSGGRLVVNAITLETEALLIQWQSAYGGDMTRIAISRAQPVGTMQGWQSAMPVTQWSTVKP
ncbi:MAG TPA: precorrin-6y C5,15-methyltransferase (decarboxylating) subunit CbiE [Parvibaculum sp.]|jgi:precorrin-6Y C5,15-methyltransferase (decarboxylating)